MASGHHHATAVRGALIPDGFRTLPAGPFGFSRALSRDLRRSLATLAGAEELPFVRGRTVIPAQYGRTVVVGHPNFFGLFEKPSSEHLVCVTGRWSSLVPLPAGAAAVATDASVPRNAAEDALNGMRNLAKRLRQIPGVHVAFKPQSPILVLLVPWADAAQGIAGIEALSHAYPELPGGIRIELTDDELGVDLNRYAATLEQAISEEA